MYINTKYTVSNILGSREIHKICHSSKTINIEITHLNCIHLKRAVNTHIAIYKHRIASTSYKKVYTYKIFIVMPCLLTHLVLFGYNNKIVVCMYWQRVSWLHLFASASLLPGYFWWKFSLRNNMTCIVSYISQWKIF